MRFLKKQIVHKSKTNMGAEKSRGSYRRPIFQTSSLAFISLGFTAC